jgi:hypothetical protein
VGTTTTFSTGGYEIQAPAGRYVVTFSSGGLSAPVSRTVVLGSQNQEVDIIQAPSQLSQAGANQVVTSIWQSYLKRAPSTAELNLYGGELVNGQATQASLTHLVQASAEYANDCTIWLHQAYQDLLGRAISTSENSNWLAWLQQTPGATLDSVAHDILDSYEYHLRLWSGWVQGAYQPYLHRAAAASEVTMWDNCFRSGMTQATFLADILNSSEYQAHVTSTSQFVTSLYINLLGRAPAAAEVSSWLNLVQSGVSRSAMVAGILASGEYQWRQDILSAAQIYTACLGRQASSSELNSWGTLQLDGLPFETVQALILDSGEYYARAVKNYP